MKRCISIGRKVCSEICKILKRHLAVICTAFFICIFYVACLYLRHFEKIFNRSDLLLCLLVYYLAKEVVITQPSTCCYEYLNTKRNVKVCVVCVLYVCLLPCQNLCNPFCHTQQAKEIWSGTLSFSMLRKSQVVFAKKGAEAAAALSKKHSRKSLAGFFIY